MSNGKNGHRGSKGVLPVLPEEINLFESGVKSFRRGEVPPNEFRAFRLQQGVYGQRQPDVNMVRVKIPFGGLTAEQVEVLGDIAEQYSALGRGHITTRENVQFHFVELDRAPEVLRLLGEVGLTSREACGNTVRNVTGCPLAGVCRKEIFDITPYAAAYARYFLRNPVCQSLPRKFKTAFSGCDSDCTLSAINDLGFLARVRQENGTLHKGFQIVVGGGLSTVPRKADTVYEFVSVEEYLRVAEGVLRVFDRLGERKNRNRARIKFLVSRLGVEEFRLLVEKEMEGPWASQLADLASLTELEEEKPGGLPTVSGNGYAIAWPPFVRWRATNVVPQRQEGYFAAYVTVPNGNLTSQQFRGLAAIARDYAGGRVRTTITQDLILRWVREEALPSLYRTLVELDLGAWGAGTIVDVVACPGTDSCSLGITSSQGLARALSETLRGLDGGDPEIDRIPIKISGCPNGCGQHLVGGIGFQGAAIHSDGRQVPAYELFLGGGSYEKGVRIGRRVTKIPAKKVPQALVKILEVYREKRKNGESFWRFVDRFGAKEFVKVVEEFKGVDPLSQEPQSYMDWGQATLFEVERGEGECSV